MHSASEKAKIDALARELQDMNRTGGPIVVHVSPVDAFALVGSLQLAWRHPNLSPQQKAMIEGFGRRLQEAFEAYPTAASVVEAGWDTTQDVRLG